ncbi:hypothetical protein KBB05_05215 [Patescibacteria group bacterium]|nr:hypothetical protein [Patescibacteria group bacterium]
MDMYEPHDAGLTIWVGSKQEVDDQIKHGFTNAQKWVLVPNDSPVSSQSPQMQPPTSLHDQPSQEVVSPPIDQNDSSSQGITEYAGIKV